MPVGGGRVEAVVPAAAVEAVVRAGCGDPPTFSPTDARIRLLNLLGRLRELCVAGALSALGSRQLCAASLCLRCSMRAFARWGACTSAALLRELPRPVSSRTPLISNLPALQFNAC